MFTFETTGLMMDKSVAFVENMAVFKLVQGQAKDRYPGKYYFKYAIIPIPQLKDLKQKKGILSSLKDKVGLKVTKLSLTWISLEAENFSQIPSKFKAFTFKKPDIEGSFV